MANTKKWMPFYVSLYLADTTHLSTIEHGAYALILFHLWQGRKPIKDSDDAFQRITKTTPEQWSKMRDVILELLVLKENGWVQKRLMIEAERAERVYKKRVKTVADLNNKRKGLSRSSRGNRNEHRDDKGSDNRSGSRDDNCPTTTLSKERVVADQSPSSAPDGAGRVPSDPPARPTQAQQDPYAHGFVDKHGRVVVHFPDGVKLKICEMGIVDLIDHDREAILPQMTSDQALDLRNRVLAGEGPQTTAEIAPPPARPKAPKTEEPFDPVRDMPLGLAKAPSILAEKQRASS